MNNVTIEWLSSGTSPQWIEDNYKNGGFVYETYSRKILREKCNFIITYLFRGNSPNLIKRYFDFILYVLRSRFSKFHGDLVIRDVFSTVFAPFKKNIKHAILVHHIDFFDNKPAWFFKIFKWVFFKKAKKADVVITVSEYWRQVFVKAGCKNVVTIYNSFDLSQFHFNDSELKEFKKARCLTVEKPLIYIGVARKEKGYLEVANALRGMDVELIATGKNPDGTELRVLNLPYKEYLQLLKAADLVIAMSRLTEGWNRVVHESMLCGTPVIGSGEGGMNELLKKGNQVICPNIEQLRDIVVALINDRNKLNQMSLNGKQFAKRYDLKYFESSWTDLIRSLLKENFEIEVNLSKTVKTKLIHVTYEAEEYGIGTFLYDLLSYQKENFNELSLAIVFNTDGPNINKFLDNQIEVHSLGYKSAKDVRSFFKYIKLFQKIDIINLHCYSPWAFFAGFILRKKIIYTFHGAVGLRNSKRDIIVKIFHKLFINKFCKKIVFASKFSMKKYLNTFKCKENNKKMLCFPYGLKIDKIKFNVSRQEIRSKFQLGNIFLIGTAARLDPIKRIERLIESLKYLPDVSGFMLIIMGDGDQTYRRYLLEEIKRFKLTENVKFLGFRNDVWNIMNALDLFVLPSVGEAFGLALIEAMALGIPSAIFSDGGGVLDIIGESGFVVTDAKELGETIMKLHNDSELAASISRKVKERASRFDIKYTAEKLNEIYKETMN